MRLHARVAAAAERTPCRVLVGGYGSPGCRDLDFGERFIRLAEGLDWPDGVVVEDLSYSAHLVLHRLQELRPAKVILVGAVSRGLDQPGTVRRYRADLPSPSPEEVHAHLTEAIGGRVALDNMLSVVRHFGALPPDTVVIEVEAADPSFGIGFSEELAAAIDPLLDAVRTELGDVDGGQVESALTAALSSAPAGHPTSSSPGRAPGGAAADAAPPGIAQLLQYAEAHTQVRALQALSARIPALPGMAIATRFLPAGNGLGLSGDWYDVLPLPGGSVGVAIADVASAPRVHAAGVAAQLKMGVHALALLEGDDPARLVAHLDTLVGATGVGRDSTLLYLTVDAKARIVRMANAGHCPPVVVAPRGGASFVAVEGSSPLGLGNPEYGESAALEPGATILVFTDGLVRRAGRSLAEGLRVLRIAAENAPPSLEALCDHVLGSCGATEGASTADDVSLLALRVVA